LQLSAELLLELGSEEIWQHIRRLQQPIIDWANEHDIRIVSDLTWERRSGILCIRPPSADAVAAALERAGVRCALRENAIRISPHWYNTSADIERVIDVLQQQLRA
jgi:selenocysteine lyase/cysteine desulfurase